MTSRHPPVTDWATDFDHTDPDVGRRPVPDLGRPAGRCPVAHSDRYGGTWLPVRHAGHRGRRLRHRALHVPVGGGQRDPARAGRPARPDRAGAADHLRSALPCRWPAACSCPPSRPNPSPPWSRSPATCAGSCSTPPPAGTRVRRRRRVRPPHPAAGHHRHARVPARGRRHLPQIHPAGPRGRRPVAGGAPGRDRRRRDRRLHGRPHRRAPGRATRRPHVIPAERRARRAKSCYPSTCAAPWSC